MLLETDALMLKEELEDRDIDFSCLGAVADRLKAFDDAGLIHIEEVPLHIEVGVDWEVHCHHSTKVLPYSRPAVDRIQDRT